MRRRLLLGGVMLGIGLALWCRPEKDSRTASPSRAPSNKVSGPGTQEAVKGEVSGEANTAEDVRGSRFFPYENPAVHTLVHDPEVGEIIEVTHEDGSMVYRFNDEVYDMTSESFSKKNH